MNDYNVKLIIEFRDIEVGQKFLLPSDPTDQFEEFVKLRFNKARSLTTQTIHHMPDEATIWFQL